MIDPKTATVADFQSVLGATFRIDGAAGGDLRLAEVTPMGQGSRDGGAFSIVFEGAETVSLEQGIHRLLHPDGTLELFLVPIGPYGQGMGFEAIFT